MVLAAMLAMMMVAAAPAMAETTDQDDGDLVDFPACFPFCEENSFDDGFFLVSLDEGVSEDIGFGDNDFGDNDFGDIGFDHNDFGDNDSNHNNSNHNNSNHND